jgi:low temperature requirement protein LtrA
MTSEAGSIGTIAIRAVALGRRWSGTVDATTRGMAAPSETRPITTAYGGSMASSEHASHPHGRRRLTGRDPSEAHRASTPLELLYDLTIVVAIGTAADQLASYVAADHVGAGVVGFLFAAFAVIWAWVNYSWFASAYDTDDWVFRLATMVQMVGVIVLALGLQQAFRSIERGATLDNGVMVAGYVVMRVSMIFLWAQVARHDEQRARAAKTYLRTIALAQAGWVTLVFLRLQVGAAFGVAAALLALEISGPAVAEHHGGGTPWHPGHIAERYGLLVIITLGEAIIGTVAALNALVHGDQGWTLNAALVALAGVGLTFGCWWMYFAVPWADVLRVHRERSFTWGYGHIAIFASLAAVGAGLRVAAQLLEHQTRVGVLGTVLSVAIPLALYTVTLYAVYGVVMKEADPFHIALLAATALILGTSIALAAAGAGVAICLLVLMFAPVVTVVGFELVGHRHLASALARIQADAAAAAD